MKAEGIDILAALKRMEEMGIVRQMTAEELRPFAEKDLERLSKAYDELLIREIDKLLEDDYTKKTFRSR